MWWSGNMAFFLILFLRRVDLYYDKCVDCDSMPACDLWTAGWKQDLNYVVVIYAFLLTWFPCKWCILVMEVATREGIPTFFIFSPPLCLGRTAVVIQKSSSGHWVQKIIRIIIICLYRMISLPHLTSQSSLYIITCQYHDLLSIVCKRVAIIDPLINVASY